MIGALLALLIGTLMGTALGLSGMTHPSKVIGFLDVFGDFDPSLAFVMGGALAVHFTTRRWITRRARPILGARFDQPTPTRIDRRLIAGSTLFGIGWGLSGFCPGPAITSLASGSARVFVFVIAMAAGQGLFVLFERATSKRS